MQIKREKPESFTVCYMHNSLERSSVHHTGPLGGRDRNSGQMPLFGFWEKVWGVTG